jgi:hypothetical protein
MIPTVQQIAAGVAAAKEMIVDAPIPQFLKNQISDDDITNAVTRVITAALNAPTAGA